MILGIFTGTITTWGQLATGGLNPELAGDNNPIITVFRTDASGENYILSDYLNTIDPSAWAKYTSTLNFPGGPQAIWPFPQGSGSHPGYNFSNWNGESGSDNASRLRVLEPREHHLRRDGLRARPSRPVRVRAEPAGRRLRAALGPRRRRGASEGHARAGPRAAAHRCLHRHEPEGVHDLRLQLPGHA